MWLPLLAAFWIGHNIGRARALGRPIGIVTLALGPLAEATLSVGG